MKTDKNNFLSGAKTVFEFNPSAEKLLVTSDGNFFLPAAASLARNHALNNGLEVFEITREEACSESGEPGGGSTAPTADQPQGVATAPTEAENATDKKEDVVDAQTPSKTEAAQVVGETSEHNEISNHQSVSDITTKKPRVNKASNTKKA